jgi:Spermidine synthase
MAVGGFYSPKLRRFLPRLEFVAGLYTVFIYFISDSLAGWSPPLLLVLLGLLPPSLIFGTHLPLYAYYLRKKSFSWVYSLYHWGPIAGLLAVEYWLMNAGSVKTLLLGLGLSQIILSFVLAAITRKDTFHLQIEKQPLPSIQQIIKTPAALSIFAISSLSFFHIAWALRSQLLVTEAFRLQSTMITVAVLFWMAVSGLLAKFLRNIPRSFYFFGWAFLLLCIEASLAYVPLFITAHFTGEVNNYILNSLALALFFTSPIIFSSLYFICVTQELKNNHEIDTAVGVLNLIASFGNIFGYILSAFFAFMLWRPSYFGLAIMIALLSYILIALQDTSNRIFRWSGVAILLGLSMLVLKRDQASVLLANRVHLADRGKIDLHLEEVHSSAFSSLALVSFRQQGFEYPLQNLFYLLDGHLSHDLKRQTEITVGLMPAKYFNRPLENSLVIGVGAGQSAWAVTAISKKADLVEISPASFSGLSLLSEYNNGLKKSDNVNFILADGFRFMKNCETKYDLILNTSTYPGNFNASKLYSEEFVAAAKNCLGPDGVFESYFDGASVQSLAQLNDFLAPLRKHFKHVDILTYPYTLVFAYDSDRKLVTLDREKILLETDKKYFDNLNDLINLRECQPVYRRIPENGQARMSTLDHSVIESHSIHNMIQKNAPAWREIELKSILPAEWPQTCE